MRFTSKKEKHLWILTGLVWLAITSTLFFEGPLVQTLTNQNVQAVIFTGASLLIFTAILVYGWKVKSGKLELAFYLSLLGVGIFFFFRLGAPERSHLMEYCVLTLFLNMALTERSKYTRPRVHPSIMAMGIGFCLGVIDEVLQLKMPNRVFDVNDIYFNSIAVFMTGVGINLLVWLRRRMRKRT